MTPQTVYDEEARCFGPPIVMTQEAPDLINAVNPRLTGLSIASFHNLFSLGFNAVMKRFAQQQHQQH